MKMSVPNKIVMVILLFSGGFFWEGQVARAQISQDEISYSQGQYSVFVDADRINFVASAQRKSQWCWAASIEMVLRYYGVAITQEQIVRRSYGGDPNGNLPNWAGSFQTITANLNNWSVDNYGEYYEVRASINGGAPTPDILLRQLNAGYPVIAGYHSGPQSGHAVVIIGARYDISNYGPIIKSVIVLDPWPDTENIQNGGWREIPGTEFAQSMQAYWYISVN
jgi:hypothetical protein